MDIKQPKESNTNDREQRKIIRIPIFGQPFDGNYNSFESYIVNLMPESTKNTATGIKKLYAVPRPAFVFNAEPEVSGEGRGLFDFKSHLIKIIGNTVLFDGIEIITLRTTTGSCGGTISGFNSFFLCDGLDGYIIYTDGTHKNVEESYLRWSASTTIETGDKRIPTSYETGTAICYVYTATVTDGSELGITGTVEPTWPTSIEDTVEDGGITWTCSYQQNTMAKKWKASDYFSVDDLVQPVVENSLYYKVIATDGVAGVTEPTWPLTIGESVTQDGVSYECVGYYGGFPSPHITTPVFMDGYIFLAEENSNDFYNSGTASLFSWNPLDFASAENYPDNIKGLARQANFVVVFGENSTELFYDAANEEGSPLSRNENYLLQVGLIFKDAIFQAEKYLMWVAKNPSGGFSVWSLNGYEAREISTETIERLLDGSTNIIGYALRIKGHILFVLNTDSHTLVYDLEEELWTVWETSISPILFTTNIYNDYSGNSYGMDITGNLYTISVTETYDSDSNNIYNITKKIKILKQDFGNNKRKFYHRVELIGQFDNCEVLE